MLKGGEDRTVVLRCIEATEGAAEAGAVLSAPTGARLLIRDTVVVRPKDTIAVMIVVRPRATIAARLKAMTVARRRGDTAVARLRDPHHHHRLRAATSPPLVRRRMGLGVVHHLRLQLLDPGFLPAEDFRDSRSRHRV